MFEATTNTRTRDAYRAAHAHRGAALRGFLQSIWGKRTPR